MTVRVGLLGATGFVGSAVGIALASMGTEVVPIPAPRLRSKSRDLDQITREASALAIDELVELMCGLDTVVNCAGDPDASSADEDGLFGANALLVALVINSAREATVSRVVHVSSAVVQNDKQFLDSSEYMEAFSPYSASKVLGEVVARDAGEPNFTVVRYRPPSVHSSERRVTRMIRRIAISPIATVARPGDQSTPQALLPNVAAAIAFLATTEHDPPPVVHHPSEGVTVTTLMSDLSGGQAPRCLPRWLARSGVAAAKAAGKIHGPTAANARRVELLWLGQDQDSSWLTQVGWVPPVGRDGWRRLSSEENA